MRLGDVIEAAAQPIAKSIDSVAGTDIQHCGGCKAMRDDLNAGMSFLEAMIKRMKGLDEKLKPTEIKPNEDNS